METLLKTGGRSLLISCMIPAIVLVTLTIAILYPRLPHNFLIHANIEPVDFGSLLAFVLVVSFVVAYTLMTTKWVLFRLYEGYRWPSIISQFFKQREEQRKTKLVHRVKNLAEELETIKKGSALYRRKWLEYIEEKELLTSQFPIYLGDLLPTRFGNIYRALENYPFQRYGMDGLFFWPRLSKVIPEDYAAKVEELNNEIMFLLNFSLISLVTSLEIILSCTVAIDGQNLYNLVEKSQWYPSLLISTIKFHPPSIIIFTSLFFFVLSYVFYYAATSKAQIFGTHVRTCYDLFRQDLLRALKIDPPTNPEDEKDLWQKVHEFLTLGKGSPYPQREPSHFPRTPSPAVGQIAMTRVALICWHGVYRLFDWLSPAGRPRITIPIQAYEGLE